MMEAPPRLPDAGGREAPSGTGAGTGLKKRYVFLAGAAYGLLMRIAFGMPPIAHYRSSLANGATGPMLASFVGLVPFLVGALTVYLARDRRPSLGYAAVAPLIPVMMFVAGTAILLIEGSICIAMALPLFLIVAMIGGVVMWGVLKFYRPSSATMGAFLLLPLLGGWGERGLPLPDWFGRSVSSVHIDAPPEAIWHLINDAHDIQPAEMRGWAWAIGVPHPVSAKTVETDGRRVRKLRWEKGVHFDEPILDWQENRYVRWRYAFAGDSIPPGALDDHVRIGGRYFDLIDTSYRLAPEAGGTRLSIEVDYRVSTNFNFYAGWWADKLVGDAARTILGFYKRRTEAHS